METIDVTVLLIPLAAVIAPLLAALFARAILIPLVVFEIGLGILLGPAGLGWVTNEPVLQLMSQFGLAVLFFMAGNEINVGEIRGSVGKRASWGWLLSSVIALIAGFLTGETLMATLFIAIALTGTALGTITPILGDTGLNRTPLGTSISAAGALGEFAPLVAISVLLSGNDPLISIVTLVVFAAVAAIAFWSARHGSSVWLHRIVSATLHTSGQFAIRFMILILVSLVVLALFLGVDFLLGAFTAGMLYRVALRDAPAPDRHVINGKMEALAYGFFVPLFFVTTGVTFPLQDLISDPQSLLLVPVFLLCLLLARGIPGYLTPPPGTSPSERRTAGLFTATSLPLIIAVTQIGVTTENLDPHTAAAMVGAGMLSVMLFPMLALIGRNAPTPASTPSAAPTHTHTHTQTN